jgi:AraC family transcriptional regulator
MEYLSAALIAPAVRHEGGGELTLAQRRLPILVDGKPSHYGDEVAHFSSSETSWAGFLLEKPAYHLPEFRMDHVGHPSDMIGVCTGPTISRVQYRVGAKLHRYTNTLGKIVICPRGFEYSSFVVKQPERVQSTVVELKRSVLQRLLVGCEELTKINLAFRDGFFDPTILRLINAMEEEIAAGCSSGNVYGESLSVALLSYLLARYSVDAPQQHSKWSLTDYQLRLVANYMHAHLDANMSLGQLANLAETGIYEFCRRFKNTTGLTPHNYLTQLRVEEGKQLLAEQRASIAEISLMLGFANQSHFTRVFRKITGITPKRFRSDRAKTVLQSPGSDLVSRERARHKPGRR